MKYPTLILLTACLGIWHTRGAGATATETIVARSGPERTSLLELFTSEGCSSCPPAEKWMASLLDNDGLWQSFVPISFHVDYWDHLGWKDALASTAFTVRQRSYADAWRFPSVYTPSFVLNGQDWRIRQLPVTGTAEAPGRLVIERTAASGFRMTFFSSPEFPGGIASLALLGFDYKSKVRSGENAGRELTHQFVAIQLSQSQLSRDGETGPWTAAIQLPPLPPGRLAIAAWIARPDSPAPIQAAGGWLPNNL